MVVYADVLVLVNFVVDYFLILIVCQFSHKKSSLWRMIAASLLGGIFSLYILVPETAFLIQSAVQIVMCMAMCMVAFGFESAKDFLRSALILFCVNFAYTGAMIAVWILFKPYGMVINNSVIYFNISPLFLILFSIVGYVVVSVGRRLLKRNFASNTYCDAKLFCGVECLTVRGIVDTGNSITDVFGISQIFIAGQDMVNALLKSQIDNPERFRKIPCNTITGERLLDGYRIDSAKITYCGREYDFKNPVLAVSKTPLAECQIIISPQALNQYEVQL